MRITNIREMTINLQGNVANAIVDFSSHTVSMVALISDQVRHGKALAGLAFNSIGRFAQGGILRERMLPRLMQASPDTLLNDSGDAFNPAAIAATAMLNEKPGGHGDRAGAVAALELAAWDLNAKLADEPAYACMARACNHTATMDGAPVYAAGGYYYPNDSVARLRDEICTYQEHGYQAFKIKIGGAALAVDLQRIEAAIEVAGSARHLAVDANGRLDKSTSLAYGRALAPYKLRWFEEPGDPLDYSLHAELAAAYPGTLATGENLFSAVDAQNLTRFGGLRPDRDILQMDPGLSYGLTEYLHMLRAAEQAGFARQQCIPHGGHLLNLHIVTALGLGACEAYPGVFQPFGGYAPQCRVEKGRVWPSDAPGFGLEQKAELLPYINKLLEG